MNNKIREILKKAIEKGEATIPTRDCQDWTLNTSGGDYDEWSWIDYKNGIWSVDHSGSSCDWHDRCPVCGAYDCRVHRIHGGYDIELCRVSRKELLEFLSALV